MTETPDLLTELPDFGSPLTGPEGCDVLSDILRRFRVTGAALLRGEYTAPWGWDAPSAADIAAHLHTPDTRVVIFHVVAYGRCWVEVEGLPRVELEVGDLIGFPRGHAHRMGWGVAPAVFPILDLFPSPPWTEVPTIRRVERGELCRILCVYLRCDAPLFDPLTSALPKLMLMRARDSASWFTKEMVRMLIEEASVTKVGSACFTARVTELLLIQLVRDHLQRGPSDGRGLIAALGDPFVAKALQAFHAAPARPWTLPEIARRAGLSESALRERFCKVLGVPPMRYLALWRLQLAALRLREGEAAIADIAAEVGYGAPEAFARAFKRATGVTPAAWRGRAPSP